jgi:excinuclease ABC subunit A
VSIPASTRSSADENGDDEAEELEPAKNGVDGIGETNQRLRRRGSAACSSMAKRSRFDEIDLASFRTRPTLEVVVDRVRIEGDLRSRLTDSIETSYREGGGAAFAVVLNRDSGSGIRDSKDALDSPARGAENREPNPRDSFSPNASNAARAGSHTRHRNRALFSFNNPSAPADLSWVRQHHRARHDLVVPDPSLSINQGAIEPWTKPHYRAQLAELKRAARKTGIRLDVPWKDLSDDERRFVVEGDGDYEGIRGFFSGWSARNTRSTSACS